MSFVRTYTKEELARSEAAYAKRQERLNALPAMPLKLRVLYEGMKTIAQLSSNYDYMGRISDEHFPTAKERIGEEIVHVEFVEARMDIESRWVYGFHEDRGLRPASTVELLSFGVAYPEFPRLFCIATLDRCRMKTVSSSILHPEVITANFYPVIDACGDEEGEGIKACLQRGGMLPASHYLAIREI